MSELEQVLQAIAELKRDIAELKGAMIYSDRRFDTDGLTLWIKTEKPEAKASAPHKSS